MAVFVLLVLRAFRLLQTYNISVGWVFVSYFDESVCFVPPTEQFETCVRILLRWIARCAAVYKYFYDMFSCLIWRFDSVAYVIDIF